MKNTIAIWLVIIAVAGLSVYASFFKGVVKQEVTISPTSVQVSQTSPRLVENPTYDYSFNMVVGNKLHLTPKNGGFNTLLAKDIGDIWFDSRDGRVMFQDGTFEGTQVLPLKAEVYFSSTQVNGGDSVLCIDSPGVGKRIIPIMWSIEIDTAGISYTGTGTDTTFFKSYEDSVEHKLAWVEDVYFTGTTKSERPINTGAFIGGVDYNTPLWMDFASQYATGTKKVKLSIWYWVVSRKFN